MKIDSAAKLRQVPKYADLKWDLAAFAVIFFALIVRISYFGFSYYCQLDDYIQYYNFASTDDPMNLIMVEGLFAARPLAALFDLHVWGRMPLYVSVVILSAMYGAAGVIFCRLLRKYFSTGFFFVVFFALLPLGFEGTYWISASARILPPLFFTAIAQVCLDRFCETKKPGYLPAFLVLCLLSFGFYEQMLVLSLALSLMMILLHLYRKQWHALWGLTVFLPVAVYFAFTGYFASADSMFSSRLEIILPKSRYYFTTFLPKLIRQLGASFAFGGVLTLVKGFCRGFVLIFQEKILAALLIPVAAAGVFAIARKYENDQQNAECSRFAPLFGFLAALAPVTPFFIIANPNFSLRSTVASFLGMAVLLDYFMRKALKRNMAAVTAVFTAVCLVASVSELYDYRQTTRDDEQSIQTLLRADQEYDLTGEVGILGMNPSQLDDQNFQYHDHIKGVTSSDWALYGAMVHFNGGELDYNPVPLATDGACFWEAWNRETNDITRFDQLLYYDAGTATLRKLCVTSSGGEHMLYFENGDPCARIWEEGDCGYIELYEPALAG